MVDARAWAAALRLVASFGTGDDGGIRRRVESLMLSHPEMGMVAGSSSTLVSQKHGCATSAAARDDCLGAEFSFGIISIAGMWPIYCPPWWRYLAARADVIGRGRAFPPDM